MRFLLDTHVVLAIVQRELGVRFPVIETVLSEASSEVFVSVASLWEMAIKTRLGKLTPRLPLDVIPDYLQASGLSILTIDVPHVITAAEPEPETRDPFDRLLLAQCLVEGLQLVTVDRALADHRLAFRF
ncbi:type II toxin-antitoxin system VapC family toxin [Rhizobium sp. BK251]|uniref:type II toxin-antitoxin system VapC family toxin n=1 Tax=Rhizobium sp. BK251 TaxID=2512125 RepID=UPI0010502AD3|nr:type II toxin-antitoxin system VapC family toxin [Rhizobium sp. BK251]TCL74793.1 PIN domain nuclease of toxin-antitoxin system [Rhizobium sp. BK251]